MLDSEWREKRRFKRWQTSIPCTVLWDEFVLTGSIPDISYGGAFITRVSAVPPNNARVTLEFQYAEGSVTVEGKVESRVVHSIEKVLLEGVIGSFSVEFKEPLNTFYSKLTSAVEGASEDL
jgi:hypothetical protein